MAFTDRYVTTTGTDTYANSTNIATPMSFTTAVANATAADRINVKVGTYSRTTTVDTVTNAGTTTSPVWWRGYSGTIGDGNLGRTNGVGDLITTNMPVINYTSGGRLVFSGLSIVESLNIQGFNNTNGTQLGANTLVKSCKVINASTNAGAVAITANAQAQVAIIDCDCQLTGASGGTGAVQANGASCRVIGCRIKGGSGTGWGITCVSSPIIIGNIIYGCPGFAIGIASTSASPVIYGNTIVGNSSDGINVITGFLGIGLIMNNLITDNTGDAIDMVSSASGFVLAYNRTRDNGSALANGGDWTTATTYSHVTTDTGGPETDYVDSSTNDYRLIAASPAIGTGYFPYMDIGAIQRVIPTGSGASYTYGG